MDREGWLSVQREYALVVLRILTGQLKTRGLHQLSRVEVKHLAAAMTTWTPVILAEADYRDMLKRIGRNFDRPGEGLIDEPEED